jgi:hypothetical protein
METDVTIDWEEYGETKKREKEKKDSVSRVINSLLENNYPDGSADRHSAVGIVADAIRCFDHESEHPGSFHQFYFESIVEEYAGAKLADWTSKLVDIHNFLVKGSHVESHSWLTNDMDNEWFFIPTKNDKLVFSVSSQNAAHLVVLTPTPKYVEVDGEITSISDWTVHVRRHWQSLNSDEVQDYKKEFEKNPTLENALKRTEWINQYYTDNVPGNDYVKRPDLEWFADRMFNVGYGDSRDAGFVYSICPDETKVSMYKMADIGHFTNLIGSISTSHPWCG